jgi:hypothetical protein
VIRSPGYSIFLTTGVLVRVATSKHVNPTTGSGNCCYR